MRGCNLRREKGNNAPPAELDATAVAERIVEAVRPPLDLGQDLRIIVGDARWERLLHPLELLAGLSVESGRRYVVEVRVLCIASLLVTWAEGAWNRLGAYLCTELILQRLTKDLLADGFRNEPTHLAGCLGAVDMKRESAW